MNRVRRIAGNGLTLLKNGEAFFPQLCADIDAAKRFVYLETYIFAADETGSLVAQALQRAAARGLSVRLMLDGFGSAELPVSFVEELRDAGVEVQWFRREISPFTFRRDRMRRLRRMHRKLAAMDGKVAFVGGINIINDIPAELDFDAPRMDYTVRIEGDLAGEVQAAMLHLWEMVSWAAFRKRVKDEGWRLRRTPKDKDAAVKLVLRDNVRHRRDIERAYMQAIAGAQHEVIVANAYFLPGRLFRRTLMQAARRGVHVVLLLQGKVEYHLQHYATLALYERLIGAGVEIYEYQPSYLHAKVAVVDGEWATVGSFNIDPFSLLLAREANLVVRDAAFAGVLRNNLWHAIEHDARQVVLANRNLLTRWLARLSYGLISFVIGVLGFSRKH
ncbi:MAG: cardiolipin synthase B [Sideroxydans sp. GWF2_59_14]|nr:MAG: cardiolipin synthase B [Sideroxydans sp. GWF2_59_14]HAF43405.1 cardiolipin synthase ClsB [Gallionellaceae bacterium]